MGMLILGFAYSLFASVLWPCIPFLVEDHQLGTAYGLVTIALNISLTVIPIIVAAILHATEGSYEWVEGLFIFLASAGLLFSILLNVLDHRRGGRLQLRYVVDEPLLGGYTTGYDHDYRRLPYGSRRYSRESYMSERNIGDMGLGQDNDMVTTKAVGEGIITIIPHRRRHSTAGFMGHFEDDRLHRYAHHMHTTPGLNGIPSSLPCESNLLIERR
ncbi:Major facilitator super domain-containing protein 1 [Podila humilis]|nr:Major facilitator super domain-containing protein 1 [Podila humilis]